MRMRQSLHQLEQAFTEQIEHEHDRAARDLRDVELRSRQRELQRAHRAGSARFWALILVLVATAVLVTVAMFETLYLVMG